VKYLVTDKFILIFINKLARIIDIMAKSYFIFQPYFLCSQFSALLPVILLCDSQYERFCFAVCV